MNNSLEDAMQSTDRLKYIDYYLRFHNNHGDCSTLPRIHGAFSEYYRLNHVQDTSIFHHSTSMIGALHFIVSIFNAYISIEAENSVEDDWEKRAKKFQLMANEFHQLFSNIGATLQARDGKSVITLLCKYIFG